MEGFGLGEGEGGREGREKMGFMGLLVFFFKFK